MLLQTAGLEAAQSHALSGTIAELVWLLPLLPLAGFVINGLLSLNGARLGPDDPNTPDHHLHSDAAVEGRDLERGASGATATLTTRLKRIDGGRYDIAAGVPSHFPSALSGMPSDGRRVARRAFTRRISADGRDLQSMMRSSSISCRW